MIKDFLRRMKAFAVSQKMTHSYEEYMYVVKIHTLTNVKACSSDEKFTQRIT